MRKGGQTMQVAAEKKVWREVVSSSKKVILDKE